MARNPLISIIIPTFNRNELLFETLNSVLYQSYKNWECLIIDDGSEDSTKNIANGFCDADHRFKYYYGPSFQLMGSAACRNFGFYRSKGDYIQFLDDDDLISGQKIELQVMALEIDNPNAIVTCEWDKFDFHKDDRPSQWLDIYRNFDNVDEFLISLSYCHTYMPIHTYLLPRRLILSSGCWNETLKINQDGEFMCRVFTKMSKVIFAPGAKAYYRQQSKNKISSLNSSIKIKHARNSWNLIENHFKNRFGHKTRLVEVARNYLERNIRSVEAD